jgi:glutathione S-transferase
MQESGAKSQTQDPTVKLEIRRLIAAPRERMFQAFARQEQMEKWMCRDQPSHAIKYLKFDFRQGGGFELDIRTSSGHIYIQRSTYLEIKPPERIAFTWALEHIDPTGKKIMEDADESVVRVELLDRGKSTEVALTHEFPAVSEKNRTAYQSGWTGCLAKLSEVCGGWG